MLATEQDARVDSDEAEQRTADQFAAEEKPFTYVIGLLFSSRAGLKQQAEEAAVTATTLQRLFACLRLRLALLSLVCPLQQLFFLTHIIFLFTKQNTSS